MLSAAVSDEVVAPASAASTDGQVSLLQLQLDIPLSSLKKASFAHCYRLHAVSPFHHTSTVLCMCQI